MQWERALADSDELDYDPSIIDISSDGEYVAVVEGAAVKLTVSTQIVCAITYLH